jgi:hypothetical protein
VGARQLRSFKLAADVAFTNNGGTRSGPLIAVPAGIDDQFVGNGKLGWYGKPILRDLYLLAPGTTLDRLAAYRARRDLVKWGLLEAVKVNVNGGYGSIIKDPEGGDNFTIDEGFVFTAGIAYELPLDRLFGLRFEEK